MSSLCEVRAFPLDWETLFAEISEGAPLFEFQPGVWWHPEIDCLTYQTRDCRYVLDSLGYHFSVLRSNEGQIVGVSLEPFRRYMWEIRKTYPGMGIDGRDFLLWPLIQLMTGKMDLFPTCSRRKASRLLPVIREFVGCVKVPFALLQDMMLSENGEYRR
ncbi:MAG: hypothetical protein IPJ67_01405 [Candidatus Moraniibacteriota bacterium]|nr:MAG: hypothetical protein IPJ67_01405 [Candidatus Moranbacteria bacterium]